MKNRVRGFAAIIACSALCLALPSFGQTTVGVNFIGAGPNDGTSPTLSEDGYTGVYNATITNLPGAGSGVICDDFKDNVYSGETWTATAYQASSLTQANVGETMFGSTVGLGGYAEVATLVSALFNGTSALSGVPGLSGPISVTDLSEAIWAITAGGASALGGTGITSNAAALVSYVEGLYGVGLGSTNSQLAAALKALQGFGNLWILTPQSGSENPVTDGTPQEFWVSVPEGGAAFMFLLLAGASCFGAMFFRSRNQLRNRETA